MNLVMKVDSYHVPEQRPDSDLVKGLVIPTIITKIGIKIHVMLHRAWNSRLFRFCVN